ncbi:MAG: NADH dehydrogenase (quinone) subunit D [Bdellovibrionales bacterium]|nr:NADH dehydrogenase (quinone) subunit D [Bdellovibrionales bacterium]
MPEFMAQSLPSLQTQPQLNKSEGGVEIITTRLADMVNMARKNSLWPMPMGISCCAIEMMAMVGPKFDVARFGSEVFRFSPRQADLMIVAGTLTHKMAPVVRRVYDQMPEPKWVIAMGACLITGGMFDSYPVVQGLDHVIPVDVYVPGCPPRPEGVIWALMQIQKKAQASRKINLVSRATTYSPDVEMKTVPTLEKPTKEKTLMLNMGPQHPSTHGVLRVVLEIDGEDVVAAYPHVGYLHRGYEKLGEHRTYHQYIPYTDRLDYLAPLSNNVAYAMAIEKLMDIEITPRNKYIRVICCELARLSAHLLSIGTYAVDLGAASIFFHTFKEREVIYTFQERLAGTRMTTSYTRIGSLARDIPEGWTEDLQSFLPRLKKTLDETEALLNKNPIWVQRNEGIGIISKDMCLRYGLTGPILRAAGEPFDIRKAHPYLAYSDFDFDIPVGTTGDSYDRYMIRMMEMRESIKILEQALKNIPDGPIASDVPDVVLPSKDKVYSSMEDLIYHFKIIGSGFRPPVGDSYHSIESPKGELGFYVISDGSPKAWRMRIKSPSFTNLQVLSEVLPGLKIADVVTVIASLDPVMGECDR